MLTCQATSPQCIPSDAAPHPEHQPVLPANRCLAKHEYVTFLSDPVNKYLWIASAATNAGPEMVSLQAHQFSATRQAWDPVYQPVTASIFEMERVVTCGTVGNNLPAIVLRAQFVAGEDALGRCSGSPALLTPEGRFPLSLDREQQAAFDRYAVSSFLKAGFFFLGSELYFVGRKQEQGTLTAVNYNALGSDMLAGVTALVQGATQRFLKYDGSSIEEMFAKVKAASS